MGFGIPLADLLRGSLRDWMLETLSRSEIDKYGLLSADAVDDLMYKHLKGIQGRSEQLWNILMLQGWLTENL